MSLLTDTFFNLSTAITNSAKLQFNHIKCVFYMLRFFMFFYIHVNGERFNSRKSNQVFIYLLNHTDRQLGSGRKEIFLTVWSYSHIGPNRILSQPFFSLKGSSLNLTITICAKLIVNNSYIFDTRTFSKKVNLTEVTINYWNLIMKRLYNEKIRRTVIHFGHVVIGSNINC